MIQRRREMGNNDSGYVKDGLIFWLDGINKGSDATAWTDLINNNLKFYYVVGVSPSGNYVQFDANHANFRANIQNYINFPYSSSTLEICLSSINGMMVFDDRYGQLALGEYNNVFMLFGHNNRNIQPRPDYTLKPCTLCISMNTGFQNGMPLSYIWSDSYWAGGGEGFSIGSRGFVQQFVGTIYSVRIYNRVLSQAEAERNYLVDKKRFNL